MKKGIATGESDFKKIIENDCFYIDKTQWIEELIKDRAAVKLFTRPRRFGKTLNMTTLKYFFSMKNAEENRKLFDGLAISKSEYFKHQGQYPLLFLSLKDVKQSSWKSCFKAIKDLVDGLYSEYKEVRENLDLKEQKKFDKIYFDEDETEYKKSLRFLCECIYKHYNKKPILLIDEYDTPIVSAYMYGYFDGEARDFLRDFYSTVLKDNEYLEMAVLSGIVRVAKEGIFSGLNNLEVYDTFKKEFPSYFGLTQKEVEEALKYYELEYDIDKVKQWYDGYNFGGLEIYNPWSILHYIKAGELGAYWVNTSSNDLIYDSLEKADIDVFNDLKNLFDGKELVKELNPGFSFEELAQNPSNVWSLMIASGYLRVKGKYEPDDPESSEYVIDISNLEIKSFFERKFIEKFLMGRNTFNVGLDYLIKGNIEAFEDKLQYIFLTSTSYFDFKQEEANYHMFVLGMLIQMKKHYKIKSNLEAGRGRTDVFVIPKEKNKLGFIFEFKVSKSEGELEEKAAEALKQIDEKNYSATMQDEEIKNYYKIGISFYKKQVKVAYETV